MATVDPELSDILSTAGRVGGLRRLANLDEAGRAAHVEMMNAARRRLREIAQRIDPEGLMDPEQRKREARLQLDIERAEADLREKREKRRQRLEAELAELNRSLADLTA